MHKINYPTLSYNNTHILLVIVTSIFIKYRYQNKLEKKSEREMEKKRTNSHTFSCIWHHKVHIAVIRSLIERIEYTKIPEQRQRLYIADTM